MSTPVVAAGAAALGFYVYLRQWQQCGYASVLELPVPLETHQRTDAPPNTWSETIYLFKEAVRYMYQETFGRWHAIDLFFGLAYLSRRATDEYPAADIAAAGQPINSPQLPPADAQQLLLQLQHVRRYMLYCQGLRHHRAEQQRKHWHDLLGLGDSDIIVHNAMAGLLRPAYVIVQDRTTRSIILCVRGTHSRPDMFTSLTGTVKPHHCVTDGGVVLGYGHLGMLAAARWLMRQTKDTLIQTLQQNPGYELRVVGHSMGGGTAAMLTMMFRDKVPELSAATAWAIACPACMTLALAASCAPFVTTLVHGTDIVPTFSTGAIDSLRQEVTHSSWFAEFQSDVRQRLATNFSSSLRGLRQGAAGTAEWTQRNIIRTAATSFSACYSRTPQSCYSRGPRKAAAAAAAAAPSMAVSAAAASRRRHPFSRLLPGRLGGGSSDGPATATTAAAAAAASSGGADGDAAAFVDASMGAGSSDSWMNSERSSLLLMRSPAALWLRGFGSSRRPAAADGIAAAADYQFDGSSDGGGGYHGSASEAALVERALEACLSAADAGELGPEAAGAAFGLEAAGAGVLSYQAHAAAAAEAHAASSSARSRMVSPTGAAAGGGGSSSKGSNVAGNFVKAASRAVLGKRPAAPSKKDDDKDITDAAAAAGGSSGGAGGSSSSAAASGLPVSTGPGGAHLGAAAAAAAANAAAALDPSADAADPATVAASSAGKPIPLSLRRRGWGWGGTLGGAGQGWVQEDAEAGSSSGGTGGRSVVEYLGQTVGAVGQTVGHTGRVVIETTGQLLRSSSVFQACAAPSGPAAAAAAAVQHQQEQQQQKMRLVYGRRRQQQTGGSGGGSEAAGMLTALEAPGSSRDLMRMERDSGPFVAALTAHSQQQQQQQQGSPRHRRHGSNASSGTGNEDLDGASDSDPDLLDLDEETNVAGFSGEGDEAYALNQPAMRASISALMAAVSIEDGDSGVARAHREEAAAAERLLREAGVGGSVGGTAQSNLYRMGLQQQQTDADADAAAAAGVDRQAGLIDNDSSKVQPALGSNDGGESSAAAEQAAAAAAVGQQQQDKAAERQARRQMYPAGRILHLMPATVVAAAQRNANSTANDDGSSAAAPAVAGDAGCSSGSSGGTAGLRQLPRLTAATGTAGLGDDYVLLEVSNAEVYGRMRLCPAMVRDHFIPSYLKAVDSVMAQLESQLQSQRQGQRETQSAGEVLYAAAG